MGATALAATGSARADVHIGVIVSLTGPGGAQGVFNLSDKDHNGVDPRSQVLVKVESGGWKLVK